MELVRPHNLYSNSVLILSALLLIWGSLWAEKYDIDKAHSSVGFTIKHLLVSEVDGVFGDYEINFEMVKNDIRKFDLDAMVKSVDTRNQRRDDDLRSDNFFDANQFPRITFRSSGYKSTDSKQGKLSGELTIKNISQKIILDVTLSDPVKFRGKDVYGIKLEGSINRKDFKVGESFPAAVVSDEVKIAVNLEVNK